MHCALGWLATIKKLLSTHLFVWSSDNKSTIILHADLDSYSRGCLHMSSVLFVHVHAILSGFLGLHPYQILRAWEWGYTWFLTSELKPKLLWLQLSGYRLLNCNNNLNLHLDITLAALKSQDFHVISIRYVTKEDIIQYHLCLTKTNAFIQTQLIFMSIIF